MSNGHGNLYCIQTVKVEVRTDLEVIFKFQIKVPINEVDSNIIIHIPLNIPISRRDTNRFEIVT